MTETMNILPKALAEALETMAFMVPVALEDELPIPEKSIMGEISFSGPKTGTLHILAGVGFAKSLAENIAALEDPDDDSCIDAMQELSNVTCGLILMVSCGSLPRLVFLFLRIMNGICAPTNQPTG